MKKKQTFTAGNIVILVFLLFFTGCMAGRRIDIDEDHFDAKKQLDIKSPATGTPGYSGMALIDDNSYIVIHDTKIRPGEDHEPPRISLLVTDCRGMYRERAIRVNWESDLKRKPNDLEGICAIPGREHEFLAVESGGYRDGEGKIHIIGHIFHLRFTKNLEGDWCGTIQQVIKMPDELNGVEGIACVRIDDESWFVILGECGSRTSQGGDVITKPARLHWDILELGPPDNIPKEFISRGFVEFISPDLASCCISVDMRSCSDMYIDAKNQLWISAALDPGDTGPFRSVIYKAGRIEPGEPKQPIRIDRHQKEARFIDGLKVEALAAAPAFLSEKAILSFATDDENYHGIWRPLFPTPR